MKITLIQAVVIFWSSLMVWVFVEYLFYRVQHSTSARHTINKSFKHHEDKPIH